MLAETRLPFLTGHGKVIGLPDLRPGDNVEISGVGRRFSGTYYVTQGATHTAEPTGLPDRVRRRQEDTGGAEPRPPSTARPAHPGVVDRHRHQGRRPGRARAGRDPAAVVRVGLSRVGPREPSSTPATATAAPGCPRTTARCWCCSRTATCAAPYVVGCLYTPRSTSRRSRAATRRDVRTLAHARRLGDPLRRDERGRSTLKTQERCLRRARARTSGELTIDGDEQDHAQGRRHLDQGHRTR